MFDTYQLKTFDAQKKNDSHSPIKSPCLKENRVTETQSDLSDDTFDYNKPMEERITKLLRNMESSKLQFETVSKDNILEEVFRTRILESQ